MGKIFPIVYLADMAKRDKREVSNRLRMLLVHLLKWEYQPRKRSRSWEGTILTQRYELQALLESRTLKNLCPGDPGGGVSKGGQASGQGNRAGRGQVPRSMSSYSRGHSEGRVRIKSHERIPAQTTNV